MKRLLCLLLCLLLCVLTLTACKDNGDTEPTREIPTGGSQLSIDTTGNPVININNSWWLNYAAVFTYYCPAANFTEDTVISEKKTINSFIVSNLSNNYFKYYANTSAGLDEYVVVPSEALFQHSVQPGASVNNINSMFMKITAVAENFTNGEDVIYTGKDTIANRETQLYLQRTYNDDGAVSSAAYLWIDSALGFCSKCVTYDKDNKVVMSWQVESFETGEVKDEDVKPDMSSYTFKEA